MTAGAGVQRRVLTALRRIGSTVRLLDVEGGRSAGFTASIQPSLRAQSPESGPLGAGRRKQAALYALLNATSRLLEPGSRIAGDGAVYRVLQTELIRLAGRPLYLWAALEWESEMEVDL